MYALLAGTAQARAARLLPVMMLVLVAAAIGLLALLAGLLAAPAQSGPLPLDELLLAPFRWDPVVPGSITA